MAATAWLALDLRMQSAAAAPSGVLGQIAITVTGYLEARFPKAAVASGDRITGIIMLGGRTERTSELVRLARRHPGARIVLSGPSEEEIAAVMRAGLAPQRVVIDRRPTNTYENAMFSLVLAQPKAGERWLIVTSATHMPRAYGTFRTVGFAVEPWPVADTPRDMRLLLQTVRREVGGLLAYRLLGRTGALVPSSEAAGLRTQQEPQAQLPPRPAPAGPA